MSQEVGNNVDGVPEKHRIADRSEQAEEDPRDVHALRQKGTVALVNSKSHTTMCSKEGITVIS